MRIAALVKQIPAFEEMALGADGRLVRDGLDLEMNAYCRRAVAQAVALVQEHGGEVVVLTMGPPAAEDTVREALAWGLERGVAISGVHLCDPALAGSDTLATARSIAAALAREPAFDLLLVGRNSLDADTGQVGPEIAELLDLPFLTGVRVLGIADGVAEARCELDDGWLEARVRLPAVLSCAERLVDPCKVDPNGRTAVDSALIRTVDAAALGPGPWGTAASSTIVGRTRVHDIERDRRILDGDVDDQVAELVAILRERGALDTTRSHGARSLPEPGIGAPLVAVLVEPQRDRLTAELLGAAAALAADLDGSVVALGTLAESSLTRLGADAIVRIDAGAVPAVEDEARAIADWAETTHPWGILAPSTTWGREVASRVAARLGAGLTGDAIELELDGGRLVAWKPAFGGQLVAAITATSPVQLATVRAGVLPPPQPRAAATPDTVTISIIPRGRVESVAWTRDDDLDVLADADVIVGAGRGVSPDEYPRLDPLLAALGAELGATRKVTDEGAMPRARQIGITGRSVAPRLYLALGISGKFNHMVGVRGAGTIVAVNPDPHAPIARFADVILRADWHDVVPRLVAAISAADVTSRT